MALLIRLSIYSLLGEQSLDEFVEVINRGRPAGYRPGAVDLTEYEVRLRTDDQIVRTATVHHLRSSGARRLARLALDTLEDAERPLGALDIILASAGLELAAVTMAVRAFGDTDIQQVRATEAQLALQLGVPVQLILLPVEPQSRAE